eukprot:CAMPEP_0201134536 /NCGR_PEP_ID=MMETSP0850-20130426/51853_1 /ASSEMBLY_ACC=CAM_ASM_000622 /TAXON_ID=183588 /ORGANISM="Pseudo-nitzschia fraudulenta, Strain WWA7" /LENGTH=135 /DNA_ID=CAMNT_0047405447 /DNA_START=276 /DNA_END=683 /DNA_ORIENTATION=+
MATTTATTKIDDDNEMEGMEVALEDFAVDFAKSDSSNKDDVFATVAITESKSSRPLKLMMPYDNVATSRRTISTYRPKLEAATSVHKGFLSGDSSSITTEATAACSTCESEDHDSNCYDDVYNDQHWASLSSISE